VELFGRESELALVTERLADRRMVTLIGPGGIGKTRLARAAAAAVEDRFAQGTHVVDLTRVSSAEAVRESLAGQLGYTSFGSMLDAPTDETVLLLVDNCEHVVDAVAEALDELLEACLAPTVLATSRTALEIPGETVVPIGPLGLPPAGTVEAPAVALFLARAADAGAVIEPDDAVAELCRRLDGVPLAIELAAARTRSMAPAEVLARLAGGLDVLDRPRRRSARRHQSLRAAIGWSHELLDPDEQAFFEDLGVFAGPFTADLAHAVAGRPGTGLAATQDLFDGLVAASMVVADTSGPSTRYRELETLRSFALARLEESGRRRAVEVRFVDHVVDRVAQIVGLGSGSFSSTALNEMVELYDNVASAVRWCLVHDDTPDRVMLLTAALWLVVHHSHLDEIGELAEQVVARWGDVGHPMGPDVAATAATARYMHGDHEAAVALATEALARADESPFGAITLPRTLGQSRRAVGEADEAIAWFERTADEARRIGISALAVESDTARAQVLADLGRTDDALALVRAAGAEAEADGSDIGVAWSRAIEGSILLRVDVDRARDVLVEAGERCDEIAYVAGSLNVRRSLALAGLLADDLPAAATAALDLLDHILARGSTYGLRMVLDTAAPLLVRAGRPEPASDLAATALALPVMSITASVGHELLPLDPGDGTVLTVRDAILLTRAELAPIAGGEVFVDAAPPRGARHLVSSAPAVDHRAGTFRVAGAVWEVGLGGDVTSVKGTKGMADLARLLARPGTEVHCLELVGAGVEEGSTGEVLDETARRAYEQRLRDLQAELDEADAHHDVGRSERAQAEMDALVDQLTSALGLAGRARRTGSTVERARSTVTQRVRSTIRRVEAAHPRLGRHLRASIRTGTFCSYVPEEPVDWDLG
jgi:predicted ATPase/tetratricopeptide (TPR) repeat protein